MYPLGWSVSADLRRLPAQCRATSPNPLREGQFRRTGLLLGLVAASLLAATASLPAVASDKVKVGFVSTLSEPSAALGVDIRDAFMLAVMLHGGRLGGLPADLTVVDDQFKPDVAKQASERLVTRDKGIHDRGRVLQHHASCCSSSAA